jgi:hypothetical protein
MDEGNYLVSRGPLGGFPTAQDTLDTTVPDEDVAPHLRAWANPPSWYEDWTIGEIRKEEMRRMIWTAASIAASMLLARWLLNKSSFVLPIMRPEKVSSAVLLGHHTVSFIQTLSGS